MPTETNNIYVDATFSDVSSDDTDLITELRFVEIENIGNVNLPTIYRIDESQDSYTNINVSVFGSTAVSGSDSVSVDYFTSAMSSGVVDSLIGYSIYAQSTTATTKEVEYSGGNGLIVGSGVLDDGYINSSQQAIINIIVGDPYSYFWQTYADYWVYWLISGSETFPTEYMNFTGSYTGLLAPIPYFNVNVDMEIAASIGTTYSGAVEETVDVSFSGWVPHKVYFDVISSSLMEDYYIGIETTAISGGILDLDCDMYCAVSGTQEYLYSDLFCCLETYASFTFESTIISGSVDRINSDLWCCSTAEPYVGCDIDIYPLYFRNFYLEEGGYTTYSSTVYVDVYDNTVYNVVLSGTYFEVDSNRVAVTFSGITNSSGITNGYRMYYDPGESFNSFVGSTAITAHAENSNGDVLEQDYYLTFGYIVSYENYDKINYGFNNQIAVRMSAENLDSCPVFDAYGYWFGTRQMNNRDLSAQIVGVEIEPSGYSSNNDLSASIYPHSNAYFYGKTFTVILNASDFDGNEMEPYEFEFEIENPN